MTSILICVGALLGACLGSFVTCAAWRLPRRISLGGRSICPACGQRLKARWNVPLLGWLLLRGRAGCCGQPIPVRYPLIELAFAAAWAGLAVTAGMLVAWAGMFAVALSLALLGRVTERHAPPGVNASHGSHAGS